MIPLVSQILLLYVDSMSEKLNRAAREAIEAALATLGDLADEAGLHQTTVARWRVAITGSSPESARKLAHALRRRALRVLDAAARLEAASDEAQEKGGDT